MGESDTVRPAWWVSWYSPAPITTFELHSPWWVSGYAWDAADNETPIICAAVRAADEDAAQAQVCAAYDAPPNPNDVEWRFCDPLDRSPFGDRWPKAEWMAWGDDGRTCACPEHPQETPDD